MKNLFKCRELVFVLIIVLMGVMLIRSCYVIRLQKRGTKAVVASSVENRNEVKQLTNEKGQIVYQQVIKEVENNAALRQYTDSIFALNKSLESKTKEVLSAQVTIQLLRMSNTHAGYADTTYIPVPIATDDSLKNLGRYAIIPPKKFSYRDSFASIYGTVQLKGVDIDSLQIRNKLYLRTVVKRTGFLGWGRTTEVQALNSNPAVTITGMNSLVLKRRASRWNKWIKPALFAAAGSFATYKLTK